MRQNLMQLGRSMVEMLGVLAVVGVLSIAGLYGYKMATLKMKANDMWDALFKFQAEVEERRLVRPEETCSYSSAPSAESVSGMYSAPTDDNTCFLDRADLIPAWANDDPKNFMVIINNAGTTVAIRHIRIDYLCSTFLSQGKKRAGTLSVWEWDDSNSGIKYECRLGDTSVKF